MPIIWKVQTRVVLHVLVVVDVAAGWVSFIDHKYLSRGFVLMQRLALFQLFQQMLIVLNFSLALKWNALSVIVSSS